MKITIPKKFEEILSKNGKIYGVILKVTSDFSDWLTDNKTEFFPEYTDHGVDHIDSVLKTASEIITEGSYQLMTPQDMYVLVMAVLLHDCAMHINRDGLWDLLTNDLYNGVSLGLDDEKEWLKKWEDFCGDVRRFSEQDWNNFFGEYREVDIPEIGSTSLDDNQKIIIGDFIRKYHATLAQVIVNNGIPSKNGPIKIFDSEFHYLNQLSGFVARSHNYSLRNAIDVLGEERKREHRDTHPTYLMGVLRISDYMQFKSDRTPKILFESKAFCSPISIREWKKHLSVISTNNSHPDEELLFVEAFPEDAVTLISIGKLLQSFQRELDEFWACMGEVYSRYPSLSGFSILYRRVKSNIDNPRDYVHKNHKSYHPEILSIEADNQKLFPLLIKPLYGDLPGVGLRELMQNSIDACNERYALDIGREVNADRIPYGITISINYDDNTLTLLDEGVGMSVEIIKNYFLRIGASYRTAESWKAQYSDLAGVYIPRTGKFGIGMLAGFLVGDEIEVHTAHISSANRAIKFSYRIDSKEIELLFVPKNSIGTSIKIYSTQEKLKTLEKLLGRPREVRSRYYYLNSKQEEAWWYYIDSPAVSFKVVKDESEKKLNPFYLIKKEDMFNKWVSLADTTLESYFWQRNYKSFLYCNGILVKDAFTPQVKINFGVDSATIDNLEISVFDNKGIFPINLTRDDIIGSEFYEILLLEKSVKEWFVNNIFMFNDGYFFTQKSILEKILDYDDSAYFPVIFSRKEPVPFAGFPVEEEFVFVDFLYPNLNRGVIYLNNFLQLIDGMAYSCSLEGEKKASTVEYAIGTLVLNEPYGNHYSRWIIPSDVEVEGVENHEIDENEKSIENFDIVEDMEGFDYVEGDSFFDNNLTDRMILNGWVFIKEFDYKKSVFAYENVLFKYDLVTQKINDQWIVITKKGNETRIPQQGYDVILGLNSKIFIFGIFSFESKETEFSSLWKNFIKVGV